MTQQQIAVAVRPARMRFVAIISPGNNKRQAMLFRTHQRSRAAIAIAYHSARQSGPNTGIIVANQCNAALLAYEDVFRGGSLDLVPDLVL